MSTMSEMGGPASPRPIRSWGFFFQNWFGIRVLPFRTFAYQKLPWLRFFPYKPFGLVGNLFSRFLFCLMALRLPYYVDVSITSHFKIHLSGTRQMWLSTRMCDISSPAYTSTNKRLSASGSFHIVILKCICYTEVIRQSWERHTLYDTYA